MVDGLERLLLERFLNERSVDCMELPEMVSLAEEPLCEKLLEVLNSASCNQFLDEYSKFHTSVRNGDLGKTAQFWLGYCECVWLLLHFLESVKKNKCDCMPLHSTSLCRYRIVQSHLRFMTENCFTVG